MKKLGMICVGLLLALFAFGKVGSPADDESAVRSIIADNSDAFNHRDPTALASHLAEVSDHIGVTGSWTTTRAEFERSLHDYFQSPRPTTADDVQKVRFVRPDVAIAIVRRQYKSDAGTKDSIATYVLTKDHGTWMIAAFQNTFVQKN